MRQGFLLLCQNHEDTRTNFSAYFIDEESETQWSKCVCLSTHSLDVVDSAFEPSVLEGDPCWEVAGFFFFFSLSYVAFPQHKDFRFLPQAVDGF